MHKKRYSQQQANHNHLFVKVQPSIFNSPTIHRYESKIHIPDRKYISTHLSIREPNAFEKQTKLHMKIEKDKRSMSGFKQIYQKVYGQVSQMKKYLRAQQILNKKLTICSYKDYDNAGIDNQHANLKEPIMNSVRQRKKSSIRKGMASSSHFKTYKNKYKNQSQSNISILEKNRLSQQLYQERPKKTNNLSNKQVKTNKRIKFILKLNKNQTSKKQLNKQQDKINQLLMKKTKSPILASKEGQRYLNPINKYSVLPLINQVQIHNRDQDTFDKHKYPEQYHMQNQLNEENNGEDPRKKQKQNKANFNKKVSRKKKSHLNISKKYQNLEEFVAQNLDNDQINGWQLRDELYEEKIQNKVGYNIMKRTPQNLSQLILLKQQGDQDIQLRQFLEETIQY